MADAEDDAEFGSDFLDSMLEVQMTEEDNELDLSKNCDPLKSLPPVPTFDLQSETFSYKNIYRGTIPQPVLTTLPLATPTVSSVPLVLPQNSMLIYSGGVQSIKPASVLTSFKKISPKPNTQTPAKNVNIICNVKTPSLFGKPVQFEDEVFKPEFVKTVFFKADLPWDVTQISEEEMKFYNSCFKDITKVQCYRLHCTICDKHLGCSVTAEKKIKVHSVLKVLTCKPCFEFYGDGNFPCDKGDNCEIYCRWCGQGGALVCCSYCPRVFCKRCVRRNFGPSFLKSIEKALDWACFCCAQKPLWPHRAVCRALMEFIVRKKSDSKASPKDTTSCCRAAGLTRKKFKNAIEKNKAATSQPQLKVNHTGKAPDLRSKSFPPLKIEKEKLLLKSVVRLKACDKVKISNRHCKPSETANIFSPKSIIAGNSIIRGIATNAPAKLFSAFSAPQLIQTPVIHGETLITPPSKFSVQAKPPSNPTPSNSSFMKISLTHQTPNLDISKIPAVEIPHEVQGLVLRLIFPDNRVEYIRLTSDGTGCKASKNFPMPEFKKNGMSFIEENLAEAFMISKMMYEKLMQIKEKVKSRTKITEESVFNSSVKKLRVAYEKTMDLFKELDRTLLQNYEEWKNQVRNPVETIELSDDEMSASKRHKFSGYSIIREKCQKLGEDSDIEILEDVFINGKTTVSNNHKEKIRLKSASEQEVTRINERGTIKKRKKYKLRKNNKRLKTNRMHNGLPEGDAGLIYIETTTDKTVDSVKCKNKLDVVGRSGREDKTDSIRPKALFLENPIKSELEEITADEAEPSSAVEENKILIKKEKMEELTTDVQEVTSNSAATEYS